MSEIILTGLSKSYNENQFVVKDLNLTVDHGEVIAIVGSSGCGKTTTLKMINRLIDPTSGWIEIDGRNTLDVDPITLRRGIGYIVQGIGLFPHMTIRQNVGIVPSLIGWSADEIRQRVDELLELVQLPASQFGGRLPSELSGGQQQRVGVARALAAKAEVILMDEPFGALDPLTRYALQNDFKDLQRELRLTTVIVTHDIAEAMVLADRIAVMERGQIMQCDTPQVLAKQPANETIAELIATPKRQADQVEQLFR